MLRGEFSKGKKEQPEEGSSAGRNPLGSALGAPLEITAQNRVATPHVAVYAMRQLVTDFVADPLPQCAEFTCESTPKWRIFQRSAPPAPLA